MITIVCVGKIKETFYKDAVSEYIKRLSKYTRVSIIEVADEECPAGASKAEEEAVKRKEGDRILSKIPRGAYTYVLAIEGRKRDSVRFSKDLEDCFLSGRSEICFVIGGSLGLHASVMQRGDESISFSDMTFPHQLMRVILLEQVYRCFRIMNHEPYHK